MPGLPDSEPRLILTDAAQWSQWLSREAENSTGVWLVLAKKGVTEPTSITYDEALDEALCEGWIDGQRHKGDETTYIQRFVPRRPKSLWSQRNIRYIARLESEGRMRERGRLEVDKAKSDGRWAAAYSQAKNVAPTDLLAAIKAVPEAQAQWDVLTKQNKFAICFRLASLKTEAGRKKRLKAFVDMLTRGEAIYPQKQVRQPMQPSSRSAKSMPAAAPSAKEDASQRRSKRLQGSHDRSR